MPKAVIFRTLCIFILFIAVPLSAQNVNNIRVYKSKRLMQLMYHQTVIKSYPIALGKNPIGHKQQEGDSRTPEGRYIIDYRNPQSRYHLSLHISYPNAQDRAKAKDKGVSPGGDIMIHGLPNGWKGPANILTMNDWTDGCIAVNNEQIDEIWKLVPNGTPIEILP